MLSPPSESPAVMARAHVLGSLALALLISSAAAQIVRSDNSPVCNTYFPQCEAKCKRGEAFIFVCSAGNGPQGGPYIICRCAAPLMANPPQQSESNGFQTASQPQG